MQLGASREEKGRVEKEEEGSREYHSFVGSSFVPRRSQAANQILTLRAGSEKDRDRRSIPLSLALQVCECRLGFLCLTRLWLESFSKFFSPI